MKIGTRIRIQFGTGSGSTFSKCGSEDPDPRQNEMDPKSCRFLGIFFLFSLLLCFLLLFLTSEQLRNIFQNVSHLKKRASLIGNPVMGRYLKTLYK